MCFDWQCMYQLHTLHVHCQTLYIHRLTVYIACIYIVYTWIHPVHTCTCIVHGCYLMFSATIIHHCVYIVHTGLNHTCDRHVLCYRTGIQYPVHTVFSNVCKGYCRWVAFLGHFLLFVQTWIFAVHTLFVEVQQLTYVFIGKYAELSQESYPPAVALTYIAEHCMYRILDSCTIA